MKIKILIGVWFVFHLFHLNAQHYLGMGEMDFLNLPEDITIDKRIPEPPTKNQDLFVELNVANDMTYFTDHYFSSGVILRVYAPFVTKSPVNKILLLHHKDALNYYTLTFTHNMYTPIYIDTLAHRTIDHPFAAYILFGNRKESFQPYQRYKVTSELQLGMIGRWPVDRNFRIPCTTTSPLPGLLKVGKIRSVMIFAYNILPYLKKVCWMLHGSS